ncbi:hypothetical protein EVG20_g8136 [Dentipellis fragilis]|uniref:Uncharacterized protein n=1 Tax=Dentipellis fragilis TaxID=205917 RepID=A0A4Y9YCA1_9AGAM|nr:hypothetical protein EVG20_g8136 [Dentipellis fragilis]
MSLVNFEVEKWSSATQEVGPVYLLWPGFGKSRKPFVNRDINKSNASENTSPSTSMSTSTHGSEARDSTVASPYAISELEKAAYYNGIAGMNDHPKLLYRSDFAINIFHKPQGRFNRLTRKSVREVYDTSLSKVWHTVGRRIRDLVKASNVRYSSIDPVRFVTYGEDDEKTLGPPVVWVGVPPSSTTPGIAHKVSQAILVLLAEHGAEDVVVEWREAVLSMFSGPPLMEVVRRGNPTSHVRHTFTPALNIPIVTKEGENEDSQGSVTLFFHENKDKHGDPSDKVLAVSNSHVLRKNTMADSFKGAGAAKQLVRVIGMRRFEQGCDEIEARIVSHRAAADTYAEEIALLEEHKAIPELEEFYAEVKRDWSDIGDRDIGHVRFTKAITVDVAGGTRYTEDWGAFEVDEAKFRPQFEGTFVDLGTALTRDAVTAMFYPRSDTRTAFKYPPEYGAVGDLAIKHQHLVINKMIGYWHSHIILF